MNGTAPLLTSFACVGLITTFAATAAAEAPPDSSPRRCSRLQMIAPPGDAIIPAQTPGVLFRLPQSPEIWTIDRFAIELRGADGAAVATTATALDDGWYQIAPARPFVEGTHVLSYADLCAGAQPGRRAEHRFEVGPAVSWPSSLGTVRVGEAIGGWEGRCHGYSAWVPIAVHPSAELRAHRGTTRFDVELNGSRQRTEYGAVVTVAGALQVPFEFQCSVSEPQVAGTMTITARTAGAPTNPAPVTMFVSISCPHRAQPGACPDAGTPPPRDDASPGPDRAPATDVSPVGPNDAGAPGVATDASPAPRDAAAAAPAPGKGGGCRVAATAASGTAGSPWVAAVALAGVFLLRRRVRTWAGRRGSWSS